MPISRPLLPNGAIRISGGRIAQVGRWRDLRAEFPKEPAIDAGDAALLPGLVNSHCHLDYTHMAGQLPPPKAFTDWLKLITTTKGGWDLSEYAASWRAGAAMLLRTGTTTVGDIEAVPQLLAEMWKATPLRVISFLEMIGITGRRPPHALLQETLEMSARLRSNRCRIGLSPHAPYSTVPELLRLSGQAAGKRGWGLCIHLAESAVEFHMFARAEGEMYDWLKRSGRDMADCGSGSPAQHLERYGVLGPNLLAAHANYLGPGDAALLARRGVSVVHCPRSHSYFRHGPFAVRKLLRAGVNVCLGTDSLATVYQARRQPPVELNLFEEMRALARREPGLSPRRVLRMATLSGARALGLQGKIGELAPGAFADVIAVPLEGKESAAHGVVLEHKGQVLMSMIGGKRVYPAAGTEAS
ncbi:MAG TPA: amidohydrolase family protein [Verrucomicrobiae bacterium]|nr:amidohydrolase family protein [Verrucomicrobiae bacterium]